MYWEMLDASCPSSGFPLDLSGSPNQAEIGNACEFRQFLTSMVYQSPGVRENLILLKSVILQSMSLVFYQALFG
jgi:hypothetical protein